MASRNQYTHTPGYGMKGKPEPQRSRGPAPRQGGQRPPAAPPRRQDAPPEAPQRAMGDTVVLALLFIVVPISLILGLFFKTFLWIFIVVATLVIVALLTMRCFEPRGRTFFTGALSAVVLVALIFALTGESGAPDNTSGNFPVYGGTALNGTTTGNDPLTDEITTQGNPLLAAGNENQGTEGAGDGGGGTTSQLTAANPAYAGLVVSNPTATPEPAQGAENSGGTGWTASDSSADGQAYIGIGDSQVPAYTNDAERVLDAYLQMWAQQNYEDMVQYTTPAWRANQTAPQRQLSWNHSGWILNSWALQSEARSPGADSATITLVANVTKNTSVSTQMTMSYSALLFGVDGQWYVDPDSLRNGIKVEATTPPSADGTAADAGPTAEPTTIPTLKLWYNSDGGSFYHMEEKCSSINERNYKSMKSFTYGQLDESAYSKLKPCTVCGAPKRP